MGLDDYKSVMVREMSSAWNRAQEAVEKAQKQQKRQYDKSANDLKFVIGDRVFVCMLARKTGHRTKLACPFEGPYRVVRVYPNGVEVQPVEKPRSQPISVALNRVRRCPKQVPSLEESVEIDQRAEPPCVERPDPGGQETDPTHFDPSTATDTWSGRLQSRRVRSRMTEAQSGEM